MNTYSKGNQSDSIIQIDANCLNTSKIERDSEASFKYFNTHFFIPSVCIILIFFYQTYIGLPTSDTIDLTNFTYRFSNYREGGNIFGIFTAMFMHGGLDHIISNLIFLYPFTLITSMILRYYIFTGVIITTGLMAGIASYYLNDIPSLGSSGWIFGLFGFLTPYYLYNRSKLSSNVQDIPWVFLFLAVFTIWRGYGNPYIDNVAHIIGFLSGILLGFIFFKVNNRISLDNK